MAGGRRITPDQQRIHAVVLEFEGQGQPYRPGTGNEDGNVFNSIDVMGASPTVVALVTERRLQGSEALQCVVKQRNRFGHADLRHGGDHGPQQRMHL